MRALPWLREEYSSPLPPAEVLRRVQASTAAPLQDGAPAVRRQTAALQGWVKPAGMFRLSRLSRSGNQRYSALTVVEGTVSAGAGSSSRVQLLHRPALFAFFILGFWLVFDSVLVVASLLTWLRGQPDEYASWGPASIFVGALVLFVALFWWEVGRARAILAPLLHLQLAPPAPKG